MARRRRTTRRASRNPATLPKMNVLIPLLLILGAIWLYQNGYFNDLLGRLPDTVPGINAPEADNPEMIDGEQPVPPAAQEPVVPQPSVAAPDVAAQRSLETQNLRGAAGSWYQVYFTKPSYPEKAAGRVEGIDETVAADISAATQRVELVSFDFDLPLITQALIDARQRGLQVRVSIDGENLEDADVEQLTGELQQAGIPVFFDERQAFMHNKFVVIDDRIVWTGSMNFTVNDVFRNNNNMLRIVDPNLAANYLAKADDIFSGTGGTKGGSVLKFPELTIGGARVRTMFAPDDPITDAIVERINAAQTSVDMLAFAFTSDPIAEALIQARQRGLAVRGVMESRNGSGSGSDLNMVRDAGIDMHTDGNCYIMHDKVFVIDGQTVITGSFNFTRSAQEQNDENVLIIDDAGLAARYTEEFDRIYDQAIQPSRCS